jgi:hypothetical protein
MEGTKNIKSELDYIIILILVMLWLIPLLAYLTNL